MLLAMVLAMKIDALGVRIVNAAYSCCSQVTRLLVCRSLFTVLGYEVVRVLDGVRRALFSLPLHILGMCR